MYFRASDSVIILTVYVYFLYYYCGIRWSTHMYLFLTTQFVNTDVFQVHMSLKSRKSTNR